MTTTERDELMWYLLGLMVGGTRGKIESIDNGVVAIVKDKEAESNGSDTD